MQTTETIRIVGAGPVGSLLAFTMAALGHKVTVYEKRADIRKTNLYQGKSINIALSCRGITALEKAGLAHKIMSHALPMYGRQVHAPHGEQVFQPYSSHGHAIHSISRQKVNEILMEEAESIGVKFIFNHPIQEFTPDNGITIFANGAFSTARKHICTYDNIDFLPYGYKEIHLPAHANGHWQLKPDALHIWPRNSFMLIALPNTDGSFTCTLFLALNGKDSFETLTTEKQVKAFFNKYFADAAGLIPDLHEQFFAHPTGELVTVTCSPWYNDKNLLIGDAAHAITPFFGQGMNAGFEDVHLLTEMLKQPNEAIGSVFENFYNQRKPNTDAIAQMALDNFMEMRDGVINPDYLLTKHIERLIKQIHPMWQSKYELVSFSNTPYLAVYNKYKKFINWMDNQKEISDTDNKWLHAIRHQDLDFL